MSVFELPRLSVCKEWERTHQVRGCNTTGEYIKAGWVDYTKVEMEADQCDAPAGISFISDKVLLS